MKVFYSWQSDLPGKLTRYLIEGALRDACMQLGKKLSEEFAVDQATRGEPGTPSIPDTILEKIEQSDVAICDVSIVSSASEGGLRSPNPNVLLELGYAAKSLGWDRVICVVNEEFGPSPTLSAGAPNSLRRKDRAPTCGPYTFCLSARLVGIGFILMPRAR